MTEDELKNIGDALSQLIQTRYVWLFNHVARCVLFDGLDRKAISINPQVQYYFSAENHKKGDAAITVEHILAFIRKNDDHFAEDEESGLKYNYEFAREIVLTGIRGGVLISAQRHLEHAKIAEIFGKHDLEEKEIFEFIRKARNILCHYPGCITRSRDDNKKYIWRDRVIENNGQEFKMTDQEILSLIDDPIESLAKVYVQNGKKIDYVSLNLGFGIGFIQQYIQKNKLS